MECPTCAKKFTRADNLKRHRRRQHPEEKEEEEEEPKRCCDVCGKHFKYATNLKKHQRLHVVEWTCTICGIRVKKLFDHERKRHSSKPPSTSGGGGEEKSFCQEDPLNCPSDLASLFDHCEEDVLECLRANWKSVRTHRLRRTVQDIYNERISCITDLKEIIQTIYHEQTSGFKINFSFGFVLKNRETNELRYYYPSQNGFVLEKPFVVTNHDDLNGLLKVLAEEDWQEWVRKQKPSSKWQVALTCNVGVYVYKIPHLPIGRGGHFLPTYIVENRGLDGLEKNSHTGKMYQDHLCYFRALARYKGFHPKNLEKKTKSLRNEYFATLTQYERAGFKGVTLSELHQLDKLFRINTFVYALEEKEGCKPNAILVHRPLADLTKKEVEEAFKINLYDCHFSYIKDMKRYAKAFSCERCGEVFEKDYKLTRHERTCEAKVKKIYPGGVYTSSKTIFEKIEEEGVQVHQDLKYSKYFATYDIEVYYPSSPNLPDKKPKLEFTAEHQLLSISVASNVPGYVKPECFIVEGEGDQHASDTVEKFVTYLNNISEAAYELEQERYAELRQTIHHTIKPDPSSTQSNENNDDDDGDEEMGESTGYDNESSQEEEEDEETEEDRAFIDDSSQNEQDIYFYREVDLLRDTTPPPTSTTPTSSDPPKSRRKTAAEKLLQQLEEHLRTLTVFGFNTGRYDLNVIKRFIIPHLVRQDGGITHCIKRHQTYLSLSTKKLRFLDILNFLAAGTSYAGFLKAYDCVEEKGFFPYEWMTSLEKLDHPSLPPHQAFHSSLKNSNITKEEYEHCQTVWEREEMSTMRDFLTWYNNSDVVPFVEAVTKMKVFWENRTIDMTQCISLPGLAFKFEMGFLEKDNLHLSVFHNEDLYELFRNNMVGGPAIIFHRYAECGETPIRGNPDKICERVVGYDANALYLWALSQPMPVGLYTHWKLDKKSSKFKSTLSIREADEWLAWMEHCRGVVLRTRVNNSEKRLGDKQFPVDGFDPNTNTVYEFHGCYWHGHGCALNCSHDKTHPHRGKTYGHWYEQTLVKQDYLKRIGHQLVTKWECDWKEEKRENPAIEQFLDEHFPLRKRGILKSSEQLIKDVRHGEFFGALEVDIHVPDPLRPKFAEMTPIFKNAEIKLEDIGDHMQAYAQEHGCMPQPRRALIGSYWANNILLATPLLQFYLEQGLVVTQIHQAIQWKAEPCFGGFAHFVSEARREGDRGGSPIVAETAKTVGNAGYGRFIMDVSRHDDVAYSQDMNKITRTINSFYFKDLEELPEDTYELKTLKKKLAMKLPIQIGFFVYQYAKLRMLQFHYQFLDHFLDRSEYQLLEMDTDSSYLALAGENLESLVKPELRDEFHAVKNQWLPRDDTPEHKAYDKREPGLFKIEWQGDGFVGLNSKTYTCWGPINKVSCKGISKRLNNPQKEIYLDVLKSKQSHSGENRGFRVMNNRVLTYAQHRIGFSYFYPKRKVLEDRITTIPLDI